MRILTAALLCLLSAAAFADIQIKDARVPAAPPTASVLTAYMDLHNDGDSDRQLLGISGETFSRIEMHLSEVIDGVARMSAVDAIELPAGDTVSLKPGGLHLMMFNPAEPLTVGDEVTLTLEFDNGEAQTVVLPVAKRRVGGAHQHKHQHQKKHQHGHSTTP
ncbi:MAG: copper chaperone PCu(A)C [Pseudomonadota bacterium]